MRKVIKILSKVISATILLLILLPLALSVLLTIPWVQNRAVVGATTLASDFLQTRVDIERVNIGALGFLEFKGLYLEDYQKDTLLYAKSLNLHILDISLSDKEVKLGYCKLQDGKLNIRQEADSTLNIKKVIDRVIPKVPPQKSTVFILENLKLKSIDVNIEMLSHRNPEYGVDYGDMSIRDIEAQVEMLTIDGPTIHTTISNFSCHEKSGFELYDLSGKFYLTSGVISFEDAKADSRYSQINIPYLTLVGVSWLDYRNFIEMVEMRAKIENSTLSSDDVAYFAPRLRNWGISISDLDMTLLGEVDDMTIEVERAQLEEQSALAATFQAKGLPNFNSADFDITVKEFVSHSTDIERLTTAIGGRELPSSTTAIIDHIGEVRGRANFKGQLSDFAADLDATSTLGGINTKLEMIGGEQQKIQAEIATERFNIGRLLATPHLGNIALNTKVECSLDDILRGSMAQGVVKWVDLRGHRYNNIPFGGWFTEGNFNGYIHSQNQGFDFEASALAQLQDKTPSYQLTMQLNDIDLKRLSFNKRDSISRLSASIKATGEGSNIDNSQGDISITNLKYKYDKEEITSNNIDFTTTNSGNSKFFELNSPYANITYRSRNSYLTSWNYLRKSLQRYLPALYYNEQVSSKESLSSSRKSSVVDVNDYSMLSVEVKDIQSISQAFSTGMEMAEDSRLDLMFNPSSEDISLSLKSQYLELNSVLALDINLDGTNTRDSLAIYGSIKELLVGTRQFEECSIVGGAAKNRIHLTAGYNNEESKSSAIISALTQLSYSPEQGRKANVRLLPSHIKQNNERWDVKARSIEIDQEGVAIDQFMIQNDKQELQIKGLASRSESDTLRVNMHNFDLSILSSLTSVLGYNVEGITNGDVAVSSALYNMRVAANVALDSVSVNNLPAPSMDIRAAWDTNLNQAKVTLTDRDKRDTLIRGYYIPSQVKYFARIDLDSVHLGLLDAPLKGILVDTKGYADARLTLQGERRTAKLEGYVNIRDLESTVGYTNVTYKIPRARVEVRDNILSCRNVEMYDLLSNSGLATLSVNLQHLSNINYAVRLNVNNLLALNTTQRDNDLFYGKLFASGVVDIKGDKLGVDMDITATTMDNSEFFMPLASKSNISTAEFIKFVTPQVVDTTDFLVRKRMMFESNRRQRSAGGSNLNINMSLNVTPDAGFQLVIDPTVGDIIKGNGEGRLNLKINPKANIFEMYGDYTISEGNYLFTLRNIINKRFLINPGSTIQWTGSPMDPLLDIEAVYELKTSLQPLVPDESARSIPVDCIIHLEDRLAQPAVSFGIELPTADPEQQTIVANLLNDQESISRQFFYLMLANSFISESSGVGSDIGVSTTASTGFELLTNQLSNWLSSSNYNVVIRYRPESEMTGDELDFGISRSLINNRLLVEVEGNYSNTDSQRVSASDEESASNFAGEAYITWLIDRMGALRLKGFTQTIDRFDENQGLQETGIGIYYRESFDNFRDLRERVKNRFSFWKKKRDEKNK